MRAVDLLPKDEGRKRRQPNAVVLTAILGCVVVTAVMAGMFLNANAPNSLVVVSSTTSPKSFTSRSFAFFSAMVPFGPVSSDPANTRSSASRTS